MANISYLMVNRELGDSDTMAAAEARAVWQRTAANRLIQEDTVRAPKLAHCPSQKAQDSHSFYLSNSWGSMDTKVDLPRQLSPSSHRDYRSEYLGLEEVLGSRFKPGLQALAAERGNMKSGSPGSLYSAFKGRFRWQLRSNCFLHGEVIEFLKECTAVS